MERVQHMTKSAIRRASQIEVNPQAKRNLQELFVNFTLILICLLLIYIIVLLSSWERQRLGFTVDEAPLPPPSSSPLFPKGVIKKWPNFNSLIFTDILYVCMYICQLLRLTSCFLYNDLSWFTKGDWLPPFKTYCMTMSAASVIIGAMCITLKYQHITVV